MEPHDCQHQISHFVYLPLNSKTIMTINLSLKPYDSIGGFECILINLLKSAALSLQTSENNIPQTTLE